MIYDTFNVGWEGGWNIYLLVNQSFYFDINKYNYKYMLCQTIIYNTFENYYYSSKFHMKFE